jgi:autotransporter-associated beta strand protein
MAAMGTIGTMKAVILSHAIVLTLALCALNTVYADSATWNANPVDNDWNNPANWTPATVPNGPNDVATFGVSSTTDVSITASIEVNSIVFSPGASAFTITLPASGTIALTISGAGITNDSGITQNIVTYGHDISFHNNASADDATIVSNGGHIIFSDDSTAANATVIANDTGEIDVDPANAGNATLIANGGTFIYMNCNGSSTARVELYDTGFLYIGYAGSTLDAIVGSIEGDGEIIIGEAEYLVVGTNHLSTVFSGVIVDDSPPDLESSSDAPGQVLGGSLFKIGTGTLTLTGGNQYSGTTTVIGGALNVANTNGSGTGKSQVNVDSGTVGGTGTIGRELNVGNGSGTRAVLEPGVGGIKPSSLIIHNALTLKADSTYTYRLNTNTGKADKVAAGGIIIDSGAQFNFVAVANGTLRPGKVFVPISNSSVHPISGTFSNLPDGGIITINGNSFQASYTGGDGNDLTLTVVP